MQECILLVTQRLTKYPVLVERILQNTAGMAAASPPCQSVPGGSLCLPAPFSCGLDEHPSVICPWFSGFH